MRPKVATEEQVKMMVAFVRAGAYPEVAARAAGEPACRLVKWLRPGRRVPPHLRAFVETLDQAAAQARATAEFALFSKNPVHWLRYGPGKETSRRPGWSTAPRPDPARDADPSLLDAPAGRALILQILEALEAFPEARAAVAAVLQDHSRTAPPK